MRATKTIAPPSLPLAGATLVLTRPAGTARTLAAQARARGATVVLLPGLSLRRHDTPELRARLHAMRCDDWIFTSPAAVDACCALDWQAPAAARVFTVGTGTRRVLARHGVAALAPASGADSEALLAMPQLARLRGRRIALVGAPGGRNLIAPQLAARGARVEPLHVYARQAPRLSRRHFAALAAAPEPWLSLLSSGEALEHLCALLPAALAARWRAQPLIVASERLAAQARQRGFGQIVVAASAVGGDMLAAAAHWLADRPQARR
ncbi:MAG: uroporphyrinogen-III synthase [Dokdonella sp.]|uniref:uroporphyrinogen-III synthase n=2 Tax=Dokdonella sp. TaxID=2291710 RepID=UPI0025C0FE96|nr:uroporphyrinogen-III synthase [Dokdonella sp.]MBX3702105.1 uroporphyrinogen-III synthase [Dokdonella sp.]